MTARFGRMTVGGTPRVVDLYATRPSSFTYLNAASYGATGDGSTNDQTALQAAFTAGKNAGLPVFVPPGTYRHSGRLTVDSVKVFSTAARSCTLYGFNDLTNAIDMRGTNPGLHNLTIRGPGKSPRSSDRGGNGVYIYQATGYVVRGCHIHSVTGAGIMTEEGSNGLIRGNFVEITGADGIYQTEGTHHLEVSYNRTVTTGDDALSVTSYATTAGYCHDVAFHHNSVIGNFESRAITINGSSTNIAVYANHIDGGTAGVSTASVTEWGTLPTTGVEVYGNTIRNINQTRQDVGTIGGGALHCYDDLASSSDSGITMHDNRIYNPGLHGIEIAGTRPVTASFTSNAFYMLASLTLKDVSNSHGSTVITETSSTRSTVDAYPGDLVSPSVGGIDTTYRYVP